MKLLEIRRSLCVRKSIGEEEIFKYASTEYWATECHIILLDIRRHKFTKNKN